MEVFVNPNAPIAHSAYGEAMVDHHSRQLFRFDSEKENLDRPDDPAIPLLNHSSPTRPSVGLKVGPWRKLERPPIAQQPLIVTSYRATIDEARASRPIYTSPTDTSRFIRKRDLLNKDASPKSLSQVLGGTSPGPRKAASNNTQTGLSPMQQDQPITHNYASPTHASTMRERRRTPCRPVASSMFEDEGDSPSFASSVSRLVQMKSQPILRAHGPHLMTQQRAERHRRAHDIGGEVHSMGAKAKLGSVGEARINKSTEVKPLYNSTPPAVRRAEFRSGSLRSPLKLKHLIAPNEGPYLLTSSSVRSNASTTSFFTARDEQDDTKIYPSFDALVDTDNEDSLLHSTALTNAAAAISHSREHHRRVTTPEQAADSAKDEGVPYFSSDTARDEGLSRIEESTLATASVTSLFDQILLSNRESQPSYHVLDEYNAQGAERRQSTCSSGTTRTTFTAESADDLRQLQHEQHPTNDRDALSMKHSVRDDQATQHNDLTIHLEDPFIVTAKNEVNQAPSTASLAQTQESQTAHQHHSAVSGSGSYAMTPNRHQRATQFSGNDGDSTRQSPLRARAPTFIPEGPKSSEGQILYTWQDLAEKSYAEYGPPPVEMLHPISASYGFQDGLKMVMPNYEYDQRWYDCAFGDCSNQVNCGALDSVSKPTQPSLCTLMPPEQSGYQTLRNEEYKVQVPDVPSNSDAGLHHCFSTDSKVSHHDVKAQEVRLSNRILEAHLEEQKRRPMDIQSYGPGLYPHTMPTLQPITEPMWMKPIGPGHMYGERNVYPNTQAKEWDEISTAIKTLNINSNQMKDGKWWEPPIPMGFGKRAAFNHTRDSYKKPSSLRGGGLSTEWDWITAPRNGCSYCGDKRHAPGECGLLQIHRATDKQRCLSCNDPKHELHDCGTLPKFDDDEPRYRKLQYYAHTKHWRKTLHQQHAKFAKYHDLTAFPALQNGKGDASIVFSWLPCPGCQPFHHWNGIQENIALIKLQYTHRYLTNPDTSSGSQTVKPDAKLLRQPSTPDIGVQFWLTPSWLVEFSKCPVVWNIQHKADKELCWTIINPYNSVAVDAFWRMSMLAVGWDAPVLPDGTLYELADMNGSITAV